MVRALAKQGYRIRVAVRRPDLAGHLQPMGRSARSTRCRPIFATPSVEAAARDSDMVVNLVGILFERGRQRFEAVQADGAEAVARAAAQNGARLVHVSAIGADAQSPSSYARSKAEGEARVLAALPSATIVRPSVIFGPEDDFFNRFAALAQVCPVLPLVGGGLTRFQPVFAGDVAAAIAQGVSGKTQGGTIYELGGPDEKTFKELMEFTLAIIERRRLLMSLPFGFAKFKAAFLQFLPNPPLTPDQVELLEGDNVVSEAARQDGRTLEGLGHNPTAMMPSCRPTSGASARPASTARGRA